MGKAPKAGQWYAQWFDTPYYHILYKDRDYEEAGSFMTALTRSLALPENASILDLACGRGRHSIYLHGLGYRVTGADLSESSIRFAQGLKNSYELGMEDGSLKFVVHNMTEPMPQTYDAVFNLFTSFGYFDEELENLKAVQAMKQNLKPSGSLVIDFMNTEYVMRNLVPESDKTVEGTVFHMRRYVEGKYLFKEITFMADDRQNVYTERVRLLSFTDFKDFFHQAGLELKTIFGDYSLAAFDQQSSPRLIMVAGHES